MCRAPFLPFHGGRRRERKGRAPFPVRHLHVDAFVDDEPRDLRVAFLRRLHERGPALERFVWVLALIQELAVGEVGYRFNFFIGCAENDTISYAHTYMRPSI